VKNKDLSFVEGVCKTAITNAVLAQNAPQTVAWL